MRGQLKRKTPSDLGGWAQGLLTTNEMDIEMNATSNGAKKQPKAVRLTPQQTQVLAHFAAMTDDAQRAVMGMLASIAKGMPRKEQQPRPQLRLVAGGQA